MTNITNIDKGHCFPYRVKQDCNAPLIPVPNCNDNQAYPIFVPDQTPPFYVVARIFDQACDVILDSNNLPILSIIK